MNSSISPLGSAPSMEEPTTPPPLAATDDPIYRKKAMEAAVKFEGLFIGEMLKQMRKNVAQVNSDDGLFKSQSGSSMLELVDTMLADSLAGQRAFGVADAILTQLLPDATRGAGGMRLTPSPFNKPADPAALNNKDR